MTGTVVHRTRGYGLGPIVTTLSLIVGLWVCLAAQARPGRTLDAYVIDV